MIPLTRLDIQGLSVEVVLDRWIGRERDCFGEARFGRCQIALDQDLAPQRQGATLLHEIFEFANLVLSIDLSHDKLTALATAVYEAMRHNPGAFARIADGLPIVQQPAGNEGGRP